MLLLCLGVAAPLLAIGSFALWKEYRTLRNEAARATTFQAAIAVRTLGQWAHGQLDSLNAIASLRAIREERLDTTREILDTAKQSQPGWQEISLLKADGSPIASTWSDLPRTNTAIEPFIQEVARTRKAALSNYTRAPLSGKASILAASPVIGADGRAASVLVAAIDPRSVLNMYMGLGETHGSVIAVVDENKRVIIRTLQNDYWQGKDFSHAKTVTAASKTRKGTIEGVGIADPTPRAYAFDRLDQPNWLVVVGVPTDTIYGSAHDWLVLMVGFAGCAIFVSVLLAFWATAHFTRTIHVLVKEVLAIGRGDFSKRVQLPARDEFGLLARAFNQMAGKLQLNREQKAMIDKISESIRRSLELDQILNTTVFELGHALKASRCCLALVDTHFTPDKSDDELIFNYVWRDPDRGGTPLKNRSILITQNSLIKVILEQGTILSLDVRSEDGPTPLFENEPDSPDDWKSIRSLIACPITTNEGAIGIILVHQCEALRVWTDSEIELVESVARHVTLAMQHARLYNRTKTMAEQEMLINHIVRSIRSSLDLETILTTVTEELRNALGADRCQIAQPASEGPLVVTHECHKPDLESNKGLSMYPEQIDFNPSSGPIKSARAASLLAQTQGKRVPGTTASMRPAFVGKNSVLGIDLERLTDDGEERGDDNGCGEVLTPSEADTFREAPLAVITDVQEDSRAIPFRHFLDQVGSQSLIAAPLVNENRLIGLLMVHQCNKLREWSPIEVQLVNSIADQLAVAIAHARLFAHVKQQAITDGLTSLYNHVYFKNRLAEEINLSRRKGTSTSLLMIDLDKLKMINDTYGHPVGDAAIRQIATILKTVLRSGDTAARYGGEEFGVILPETTLLEAALIADRLCSQIRNSHVPGLGRITASIGAASYPKQAENAAELIEKADKALYVAKNSGRDQVRIYEEEKSDERPVTAIEITLPSVSVGAVGDVSIPVGGDVKGNVEETRPL